MTLSRENKNLIITYLVTLGIAGFLIVVIVNFNTWFFPDEELRLSEFTPASRRVISEADLRFGLLSDEKFTSLQPILSAGELTEPQAPSGTSGTITPTVRPPVELRRSNPFTPF